jgi:RNA polymerase sigma factor (sigma-70 family)
MLRFAVLQLRDQASAEDAVQEAMLAALQGADRFGERAKLKTWVFSILRNKIVDIIRRRGSRTELPRNPKKRSTKPISTRCSGATATGNARPAPSDWGNPRKEL